MAEWPGSHDILGKHPGREVEKRERERRLIRYAGAFQQLRASVYKRGANDALNTTMETASMKAI